MSESVFNLITHLCQVLCNDFNKARVHGHPLGAREVKKYRNEAFEIILKGNKGNDAKDLYSFREFQFHQFDMRQNAKTTLDRDRCDQLEKCIEKLLSENRFFRSDSGQSILMLLLLLKNSIRFDAEHSITDYYPFGFFSAMQSCTETNPYICIAEGMCGLPKKLDIDVENQYRQFNPYMPNPLIFLSPKDPKYEKVDYFFKLNYDMNSPSRRSSLNPLPPPPPIESQPRKEETLQNLAPKTPPSLSWINLGRSSTQKEKPFVSEVDSAIFHLMNLLKCNSGQEYSLKVVPEHFYLMNLKYLCSGVQSDLFVFDAENVTFSLRETGLTIRNIAPETLAGMNKSFITFGTCFKRLELASSVIPDALVMPVEGFVYKALSKAVNQFLFSIRHFIFNGPKDETIMQFSLRLRQYSGIIEFFGKLFKIHPQDDRVLEIPKGSRLLIYLYDILMDEMNKQDKVIPVVTIIRDCCQAYYQLFQQWIFNGILTDPYEELFIIYSDQYKMQTKYYFDKSFYSRVADVPPFLKGYEQDVLLCGKYTMLLREYKPNHKIFSITKPPKIHVCLSHEGIQRVKEVCREYLTNGYKFCGGRISVKEIFSERREKRDKLKKTVSMRFKENLIKWQEEVQQQKCALLEEKKRRVDELLKQIEEKKLNELERRRAEIELEKECEEYDHKLEEIELQKVAEERRKRIDYYEELNQIANIKKGAIDEAVSELEKELQELKEATYNENYKLQLERNLDLLNANSVEFSKNKTKVLGSQLGELMDEKLVVNVPQTVSTGNLTEAQRNKLKVLSEEFDLKNYENCDNKEQAIVEMGKKILTDAQRNKNKVMAHEFNNNAEVVDEDEVVLVERSTHEMTPLERNRAKGTSHHLTDNYFKKVDEAEEDNDRKAIAMGDLTEMERNRLKVMSHEFGINVPMELKLKEEISEETMTELQKNRRKVLFGNVTPMEEIKAGGMKNSLSLDLTEREKNKRKFFESELGQQLATPSTSSAIVPSPMSMTSDPDGEEEKVIKEGEDQVKEDIIKEEIEDSGNASLNETIPKMHNASFMDFLMPLIATGVPNVFDDHPLRSSDEDSESGERDECPIQVEFKRSDLKKLSSLNFETLNQLLQQSLTIPLKTQLELMNNEILKMYLLDLDIYSHFKSLRNYFFLMDGEFGIHICEGLISALERGTRPSILYSYNTLNTTLEQAFGASVFGKDKNGARLSFAVNKNITTSEFNLLSPNVLEDLELMYQIEWPLNLILCPKAIHQYATVFQYLLKVRRISWVLENSSYMSLKASAKTLGPNLLTSKQYRHVQLIRHKFSQFVNCLKNHISSSAVQSSWKRFKDDIQSVTSMADLYSRHSAYIKQIRFLCMLNRTSQEFQQRINDIFTIILRFNSHLNSGNETDRWRVNKTVKDEGKGKKRWVEYEHLNYDRMCRDEQDFDKCCNYVMYLGGKIVRRGYQVELNEFLNLVNINGFYKGVQQPNRSDSASSSAVAGSTAEMTSGDARRKL